MHFKSICHRKTLDEVIATVDAIVLLRLGLVVSARDGIDEAIEVRIAEVCNAVSCWVLASVGCDWGFDDSVLGTLDDIV